MDNRPPPNRIAIHESGHAIVAAALGCAVERIFYRPNIDSRNVQGSVEARDWTPSALAAVALAGMIAERMAGAEGELSDGDAAALRNATNGDEAATEAATALACKTLREHWRAVLMLARRLETRGYDLPGEDAARAIEVAKAAGG